MCEESGSGAGAGTDMAISMIAALPGFVARNALPFAIAAVVDMVAAFALAHPFLIIACSVVALLAATVGRIMLARWLLRVMGRQVVPVGLERLRPARGRARSARVALPAAEPARAIPAPRAAPLAIEAPRSTAASSASSASSAAPVARAPARPVESASGYRAQIRSRPRRSPR